MISIYHRAIRDKKIKKLKEARAGCWVNCIDPTEKEINQLRNLGIDMAFIEDALDPDELPRVEVVENIVYVMLNTPQIAQGKILNIPLLVAVTNSFFVTISKRPLDCLGLLFESRDFFTTQKAKNLLNICLQITQGYTDQIRRINKRIAVKKISLSKLKNKDVVVLVEFEETLSEFITSLVSLIGIFEKLLTGKYVAIFKEDEELMGDLIIDSRQSLDMCKSSIKKIINIREAYSTILSNNLNRVMKFLASLTLIMGVPTIIASFYGMNVRLPLQRDPFAFLYVFTVTFFLSLGLVLIFYLKGWL